MSEGERRLAAIMFTDIAGYTALTRRDESLSMRLLEEHRAVVRPFFPKHGGREVKTIGDAFLVEFGSALEAVRCAYDIQQSLHELNNNRPADVRVEIRAGIHLGDVIHSHGDVYGDAVNVASRIEPLATPGGICISEQVHDHVKNKLEFPMISLGRRELKNVGEAVEVFRVVLPWEKQETTAGLSLDKNRIAVLPFAKHEPRPRRRVLRGWDDGGAHRQAGSGQAAQGHSPHFRDELQEEGQEGRGDSQGARRRFPGRR
ncbi:MAG TPA: adenylate/guanylate cyclase domain-containing protein [Nitrososphaerales archaeon]|nr:adenylate/guanylate cyclase domain-containing protein [Nitrososphaerales archaeon]